jgi:NADH-quinone oxidoreductase subunit I
MFGLGVVKGLGVTLKHFIETFVDDLKYFPKSLGNQEAFARRQGPSGRGLFTVEYPEMKLAPPENFRFMPFLVTDYDVPKDSPDFDRAKWLDQNRCTSCGICAKVCPPQCIWIVRTNDPATGRPIPQPAEFYIDIDICMNCGYCAEFCPFDAIKMDHDFELADYSRQVDHIHNLEHLLKPVSHYAAIRPGWHAKEKEVRLAVEEEKRRKEEEKARQAAQRAAAKKAKAAATDDPAARIAPVDAPALPPEPKPAAVPPAVPAKADDLTKVEGIGPKINGLLKAAGITTFAALAAAQVSRLQEILAAAGARYQLADPATWPEQAALAAAGKRDELEAFQNTLKGGRRTDEES